MIYLIIGNHQSLSGVWEQIEITLKTFKKMDIQINLSSQIKPGHVNILIEDFNSYITDELIRVKTENPHTQYVLYPTEYCTQNSGEKFNLNCFSKMTRIVRRLFCWEYQLCGDTYQVYLGGTRAIYRRTVMRRLLRPILKVCAVFAGSTYSNELMMARREVCLHRVKGLFSLCIATTEAVLSGYHNLCGCPMQYLPAFIDKNRMRSNRDKSRKYPSIIFSGRMTPYRRITSIEIGLELLNSYPLKGGDAWGEDKQLKDTEFKIQRLEREVEALGQKQSTAFATEIKQTELPSYEVLTSGIYEYVRKSKTAAYELYIPQSATWPYSSPNRTILSIESGLIPVDYGEFSDHAVNSVPIKAVDKGALKTILASDLNQSYDELDDRVDKYNEEQSLKIPEVKAILMELCHGDTGTWDDVNSTTFYYGKSDFLRKNPSNPSKPTSTFS